VVVVLRESPGGPRGSSIDGANRQGIPLLDPPSQKRLPTGCSPTSRSCIWTTVTTPTRCVNCLPATTCAASTVSPRSRSPLRWSSLSNSSSCPPMESTHPLTPPPVSAPHRPRPLPGPY